MPDVNRSTREYYSPIREQRALETRRRIIDAARRLFASQGYSGTTMAEIASEANVAMQTIYSQVGSKQNLMLAILDRIEELAETKAFFQELQQLRAADEMLDTLARFQRRFWEQGRDVVELALGSAPLHADLVHLADLGNQRHKRGQRRVVEQIERTGALRTGLDVERALAIQTATTSFAVYRWLVDEYGWSGDQYETWLADTLKTLLLSEPVP